MELYDRAQDVPGLEGLGGPRGEYLESGLVQLRSAYKLLQGTTQPPGRIGLAGPAPHVAPVLLCGHDQPSRLIVVVSPVAPRALAYNMRQSAALAKGVPGACVACTPYDTVDPNRGAETIFAAMYGEAARGGLNAHCLLLMASEVRGPYRIESSAKAKKLGLEVQPLSGFTPDGARHTLQVLINRIKADSDADVATEAPVTGPTTGHLGDRSPHSLSIQGEHAQRRDGKRRR